MCNFHSRIDITTILHSHEGQSLFKVSSSSTIDVFKRDWWIYASCLSLDFHSDSFPLQPAAILTQVQNGITTTGTELYNSPLHVFSLHTRCFNSEGTYARSFLRALSALSLWMCSIRIRLFLNTLPLTFRYRLWYLQGTGQGRYEQACCTATSTWCKTEIQATAEFPQWPALLKDMLQFFVCLQLTWWLQLSSYPQAERCCATDGFIRKKKVPSHPFLTTANRVGLMNH